MDSAAQHCAASLYVGFIPEAGIDEALEQTGSSLYHQRLDASAVKVAHYLTKYIATEVNGDVLYPINGNTISHRLGID
jgi:F420-0:gamma-glutamyl ligase